MGNKINFKTETNGYMKDQVDRYIDTFAGAYRDLTQAYEQAREQLEIYKDGKNGDAAPQVIALNKKLEEQDKLLEQKNSEISKLKNENEKYVQEIASLKERIGTGEIKDNSTELIAKVMIDAKVFASKLQEQAQMEAEEIRQKAKLDVQAITNTKKRSVEELKKLQSMIQDVIHRSERLNPDAKGDSGHAG